MEKAKVLEAAKILNAATYTDENGEEKLLLTTKIKVVAIKEQDLAEMFMSACESIPEALEDQIPDQVGEVYNALVDEQEKAEASAVSDASVAAPQKPDKKPDKKAEGKKKGGFGNIEKNKYGHMPSKISGQMDALLEKGGTVDDIAKKLGTDASRVKNHIAHLKKDVGVKFIEKDGHIQIQ